MIQEKTLVISGLPFRDDTNLGKTLCALFADLKPAELCNLYLSPQLPNVKNCNAYFQLDEKRLLVSALSLLWNKCGRVVCADNIANEYAAVKQLPHFLESRKRSMSLTLIRETLWKLSPWKYRKLDKWLNDEKPTKVFCIMPGSIYTCKLISRIAIRLNLPVYMFVTDDYYNDYEIKPSFVRRKYFRKLHNEYNKLMPMVHHIIGCCEVAAEEFGRLFNKPSSVIFTPSALSSCL